MALRRNDTTGLLIVVILFVSPFVALYDVVGNWAWALAASLLATLLGIGWVRAASRRCSHGTRVGSDPDRCSLCASERETRELEAERAARAEQARQARERQTAYAEWAERVRVPEYLRTMDPIDFERLTGELFTRLGYTAQLTPTSGDGGVDVRLTKEGATYLVQCKRVRGSVGEGVVRDLFGVVVAEGATEGWVVTTGTVTNPARTWAVGKPIRFIELRELKALLEDAYPIDAVVPADFVVPESAIPVCPECGARLRKRRGKYGRFLGCSSFPRCRYTRELSRRGSRRW